MTFPFPFISPGGTLSPPPPPMTGSYTFVNKAILTDTSPEAVIGWDNTIADILDMHDDVTDTSKFIVPVALNGRYGRMTGGFASANTHIVSMLKNGATFVGAGKLDMGDTTGSDFGTIVSAPVLLATGDEYEFSGLSAGDLEGGNEQTWACFELLPNAFDGALVYKSGTQANNNANNFVTFDLEQYDTLGFHDNVTNNHLFTIPSGVTLVRLSGAISISSATTRLVGQIWKNGALFRGTPLIGVDSLTEESVTMITAPIVCTPGDTFELRVFTNGSINVVVDNTWFAIEVLDPALKYALVHRTTTQHIAADTLTAVEWTAEVADTDAFHDNSTNPSHLTVPSGISQVRLSFGAISVGSATGYYSLAVFKNGAEFDGMANCDCDFSGIDATTGMSAIVEVNPGDYFELMLIADTASHDIGAGFESWFAIEEYPDYT